MSQSEKEKSKLKLGLLASSSLIWWLQHLLFHLGPHPCYSCYAHWCGLPLASQKPSGIRDFSHILFPTQTPRLIFIQHLRLLFYTQLCKKSMLITFRSPHSTGVRTLRTRAAPGRCLPHIVAYCQGVMDISPDIFWNRKELGLHSFNNFFMSNTYNLVGCNRWCFLRSRLWNGYGLADVFICKYSWDQHQARK